MSQPPDDRSVEEELQLAFGRAIGFTLVAIITLVGGGVAVIALAAVFFSFLYGR